MKKEEYLSLISQKTKLTKKDIDLVITEYLELVKEQLKANGKVSITNFGTFKKNVTKPFSYFSPIDGSSLETEGIVKISFSSSKQLLEKMK